MTARRIAIAVCAAVFILAPISVGGARARPRLRKKTKPTVVKIQRSTLGTTLWLRLDSAPFPAAGAPYRDATVIVFVPRYFRVDASKRIDVIMHFHGHHTTAAAALKRFMLPQQLFDSRQNAILVVPQGPVNAADSRGGKLDRKNGLLDLLTDVRRTLQRRRVRRALRGVIPTYVRVGRLALSAHSGGWRVVANCLRRGGYNVNEVYLFDALYADAKVFADWLIETKNKHGDRRHKLVSYFADPPVLRENRRLMRQLRAAKVRFSFENQEGRLSRRQITQARAIFVKTRSSHSGMVFVNNALRDCLFASRFKRYLRASWFKEASGPRPLDRRRR